MAKKDDKTGTERAAQIGARKLKELLKASATAAEDVQEITSTLGGQIGAAVENNHLHKKAFSTLRMMNKMSPERLADYWDTLQFYVDISGLGERAASAPKMALDREDDDDGDGKVTKFPAAAE